MRARTPNILLITTDTHRVDALACMGNPHAISPNLDRLASEGVLFEQAHTICPVCGPARCSLITGVPPTVHGATENGLRRRDDLPAITDALENAGYHNVLVGKAHFGEVPTSFHVAHVLAGEKNQDRDDFYATFIRGHGFSRATDHPNPTPDHLTSDAHCVDVAISELKSATRRGKPWFMFCSLLSPHPPYDPPARWMSCFDDRSLPDLNYQPGDVDRLPAQTRYLLGLPDAETASLFPDGVVDVAAIDAIRRRYYALCAYTDAQIGRLLAALDETDQSRETLIIFTSDHGTTLFDHGFDDKHNYFDKTLRVPLIVRLPGGAARSTRCELASWLDVSAMILHAAGADTTWVHGLDLYTPLLSGLPSPRHAVAAVLHRSMALVSSRWKLEVYLDDPHDGRLIDRQADPLERQNLVHLSAFQEVRSRLTEILLRWRSGIEDVAYLRSHVEAGGPVATRVGRWARDYRADANERRLNESVREFEKYTS